MFILSREIGDSGRFYLGSTDVGGVSQNSYGGHAGAFRTMRRLSANVYWIGMKRDVYQCVAEYDVCR